MGGRRSSIPTPPRPAGRVSSGDRSEGRLAFAGSQFTTPRFTDVLIEAGVQVSMDGKGRWMDTVVIERLWRSLKDACIDLDAFETGAEARAAIGSWITYSNTERPHSARGGRTPREAHGGREGLRLAAQQKPARASQCRHNVRESGTTSPYRQPHRPTSDYPRTLITLGQFARSRSTSTSFDDPPVGPGRLKAWDFLIPHRGL